jgi:hypothetical protein
MARRKPEGNFIGEWFGHRTYPLRDANPTGLENQVAQTCPFLSGATHTRKACVKNEPSSGVCTISSAANGVRQDWLVCPFRALDTQFLESVARRLFNVDAKKPLTLMPGSALTAPPMRAALDTAMRDGTHGVLYLQSKLGGEISIPATTRSPEFAIDFTMVEVVRRDGACALGRLGFVEVQTMDFHGSYKHAVANLRDGLRLHGSSFPRELQRNPEWLAKGVEGPNTANVFKRTFYQIVLKFRFSDNAACAGCVLAIPTSVWDSWQKHLAKPRLIQAPDGTFVLPQPDGTPPASKSTWIYVFDIDGASTMSPNPIVVRKVIATDAKALYLHAFEAVPVAAAEEGVTPTTLVESIHGRLAQWWPDLRM